MESRRFGDQIYKSWGLDSDYNYRAVGRLVTANQKVMMLFDFNKAEQWKSKRMANNMADTYISFYLRNNRIHVFVDALRGIGSPKYICL